MFSTQNTLGIGLLKQQKKKNPLETEFAWHATSANITILAFLKSCFTPVESHVSTSSKHSYELSFPRNAMMYYTYMPGQVINYPF